MDQQLVDVARNALEHAHAPYSRFQVGAAVRADNGRIYGGCNVENASYPEGICAETAAIAAMVLDGGKRILEMAITTKGAETTSPCGGCRQRIREFAGPDVKIHTLGPEGHRQTYTLGQLLPFAFGPEHL